MKETAVLIADARNSWSHGGGKDDTDYDFPHRLPLGADWCDVFLQIVNDSDKVLSWIVFIGKPQLEKLTNL